MNIVEQIKLKFKKNFFSTKVREDVWMYIAALLKMEIPLNEALELGVKNYKLVKKKNVSDILDEIRKANSQGNITHALRKYSSLSEMIVFRGINKNDTIKIFETNAKLLKQANDTKALMITLLMPPFFILLLLFFNLYLFSGLVDIISGFELSEDLTTSYYFLAYISKFLTNNLFYILAFITTFLLWIAWLLPNWTNKGRQVADNFFPFSHYKKNIGTSFLITMTELAKVGETITSDLLHEMKEGGSPYFISRISEIANLTQNNHWGNALILGKYNFPNRELNLICSTVSQKNHWENNFLQFVEKNTKDYNAALKKKLSAINIFLLLLSAFIIFLTITTTQALQNSI